MLPMFIQRPLQGGPQSTQPRAFLLSSGSPAIRIQLFFVANGAAIYFEAGFAESVPTIYK
jgi:hypothetical protein